MLTAFLPWIARAYDFSVNLPGSDHKLYYQVNSDKVTVSVATPPETYNFTQLTIPSEVSNGSNTYKVTGIASKAFYRAQVFNVELPATIETIGPDAFGYSKVSTINFPASLKSIGNSAFSGSSIQSADLKDGIKTIGSYAFSNNTKLIEVTLPSTLKTIDAGAFSSTGLLSVNVPGSIRTINDNTFQHCYSMTKLTLGEGIESIGIYAFSECRAIESLILPESLISTDYNSFSGCSNLKEIKFGSKLTTIGNQSFVGCGVKDIIIPDNVTMIEDEAFGNCRSLETIEFSKNMEIISARLCSGCSRLYKVVIPEGIKYIGSSAFSSCSLLTHIDFPNSLVAFKSPNDRQYYGAFYETGLTEFNFPPKVTEIPSGLLTNCKNLTKIVIPDHIKTIESSAFSGCTSLTEVVMPDFMETLPANIFNNCTSLPSFKFPTRLKKIEDNAFYGCTSISEFNFPDSIVDFGRDVFGGCTKIKEITLPSLNETSGAHLFYDCANLQSITYSTHTKSVYCLSENLSSLQEVHVPVAIPPAVYTLRLSSQQMIEPGNNVTLYVPVGAKTAYGNDWFWNSFFRIVEEEVKGVDYGITAKIEGSGSVEINGTMFNYNAIPVRQGEKAVVKFIPSSNDWLVAEVTLNGKDVTADVVDNEYIVENVNENCEFDVRFARCPVILTIHSGELGMIRIPVEYNHTFSCSVEATEGWSLVKVMMDGMDVTSLVADGGMLTTEKLRYAADIYITYEKTSGVETTFEDAATSIYADGGMINICGLPEGCSWAVYDIDGIQVASGISQANNFAVSLPVGRIYIVKTTSRTVKLVL